MTRTAQALTAATLLGATLALAACGLNDDSDDDVVLVPYVIPAVGLPGSAGYLPAQTIQPGAPNYRPTYQGKPSGWTPPPALPKINNPTPRVNPPAPPRPAPPVRVGR